MNTYQLVSDFKNAKLEADFSEYSSHSYRHYSAWGHGSREEVGQGDGAGFCAGRWWGRNGRRGSAAGGGRKVLSRSAAS